MFEVPLDRSGECPAFEVAADRREVSWVGLMADASDLLFDDRSLVEVGGDVVRGGANELHATNECLLVGLPATEARKE